MLFLLSGCLAQSEIQARYMGQEDGCRAEASRAAAQAEQSANANAQNRASPASSSRPAFDPSYILASTFSECMNKKGWKITPPKAPGTGTATAGNTIGFAPGAPLTAARQSTSPTSAIPASPILGPGVQPDPAPAYPSQVARPATAANTTQTAPSPAPTGTVPTGTTELPPPKALGSGVSTYQPARPDGVTSPDFGRGAGRQF